MIRTLPLVLFAALTAGCISFNTTESPSGPDYAAFCQDKEAQCRQICGEAGIATFSCKAAPREGLEYACRCKEAGTRP